MSKTQTKLIKLIDARLSFPSLFKKAVFEGNETKYEATLLISKDSKQAKMIQAEAEKFAVSVFGEGKVPKSLKYSCITDGDMKDYDGYENMIAFKGGSGKRFPVVDRDRTPLTEEDGKPEAGDYVNAAVSFWYSNHNLGGKQILGNIAAIQFSKLGERFGAGGVDADDVFDELGEEDEDEVY